VKKRPWRTSNGRTSRKSGPTAYEETGSTVTRPVDTLVSPHRLGQRFVNSGREARRTRRSSAFAG
jgi:hypothetical protein